MAAKPPPDIPALFEEWRSSHPLPEGRSALIAYVRNYLRNADIKLNLDWQYLAEACVHIAFDVLDSADQRGQHHEVAEAALDSPTKTSHELAIPLEPEDKVVIEVRTLKIRASSLCAPELLQLADRYIHEFMASSPVYSGTTVNSSLVLELMPIHLQVKAMERPGAWLDGVLMYVSKVRRAWLKSVSNLTHDLAMLCTGLIQNCTIAFVPQLGHTCANCAVVITLRLHTKA